MNESYPALKKSNVNDANFLSSHPKGTCFDTVAKRISFTRAKWGAIMTEWSVKPIGI